MRIFKYLYGNGAGIAVFMAAAILLAAPYGCSKEKDSKAPEEAAETAPESQGSARINFDRGVELSLKGDLDASINAFEAAIMLNPNIPEAHNNLGFAYMDKGELDKAVEHQKTAIELKPDLANGYFGLAMAYEKMGKKEESIANWKEFMKLSQPHSKWWLKAKEHLQVLEGTAPPAPKK